VILRTACVFKLAAHHGGPQGFLVDAQLRKPGTDILGLNANDRWFHEGLSGLMTGGKLPALLPQLRPKNKKCAVFERHDFRFHRSIAS
jgi:hypothetical protein